MIDISIISGSVVIIVVLSSIIKEKNKEIKSLKTFTESLLKEISKNNGQDKILD